MDHISPTDRDFEVDLESGLKVSVENSGKDPVLGVKIQSKAMLAKFCGVFAEGKIKGEEGVILASNAAISNGVTVDNVKLGEEKAIDHLENKVVKEKRKKTANKKSPKPPRPPRGPSLDAADQKLIKEITELAMLKRARIERMKSLKKMKAAKLAAPSSSNSNLLAMVFTILFCLVIIFQGMSSGDKSAMQQSPVSAELAEGGLISVQHFTDAIASDLNAPGSGSPILGGPVAGSDSPTNAQNTAMKSTR